MPAARARRRCILPPVQERLLLAAAALWVIVWGALAILNSDLPSGPDSFYLRSWDLYQGLVGRTPLDIQEWLQGGEYYPPLPALWGTAVALITTLQRELIRLGCLALHVLLIFQIRWLVLDLTACRTSALIACWAAATLPIIAGWFRMDFPEPLVAVMLMATAQVATRASLERGRGAALLGGVIGMGMLTKLSFCLFLLVPGLYFLVTRVRGWLALRNALVTAAVAALVGGWWYLLTLDSIRDNFFMSTHKAVDLNNHLSVYFLEAPENLVLSAFALASVILAIWRGTSPRWRIGLLAATVGCGYAWLVFVFDVQQRYMVPLLAPALVLSAVGLASILGPARARTHKLAILLGLPCLMALSSWANMVPRKTPNAELYVSRGLISPDADDISGLRRAHRLIRAHAPWYVVLSRHKSVTPWLTDQHRAVLQADEITPVIDRSGLIRRVLPPGPLHVLEVGLAPDAVTRLLDGSEREAYPQGVLWRWFLRQKKTSLQPFYDQADLSYTIHRLDAPDLQGLAREQGDDGLFGVVGGMSSND